jgi:hypothetical protein
VPGPEQQSAPRARGGGSGSGSGGGGCDGDANNMVEMQTAAHISHSFRLLPSPTLAWSFGRIDGWMDGSIRVLMGLDRYDDAAQTRPDQTKRVLKAG